MSPIPRPSATNLHVLDHNVYGDWESVYRDDVDRLYRLTYGRVGNRPEAEHLTAEDFRTPLGPLRLGSSKTEVRADLLVTAKTVLAAQWHRRLGLPVTSIDHEVDRLPEPAESVPPSDARRRVIKLVATLPDRDRRILELRFLEARSIKEAARAREVSLSNAGGAQHRVPRMVATHSLEPDG
jgi:DNA-directed RNA polymerase specialized sigma24 family protein